jgi:Domain of unknown function (DUF4350)
MRRRVLKGLGLLVAGLAIAAALVNQFTPHSSGTPSSSYASAADGLAGYAELLIQAGHRVNRLRVTPAGASLDPGQTVVVLDPSVIVPDDVRALRSFVARGGRLIAGGRDPGAWLGELLSGAPSWSPQAPREWTPLLPVPETAGVSSAVGDGTGAWNNPAATLPVLGQADESLVTVVKLGAGRVVLLADSSPLQNHLLADADNAALGLALAGPAARPIAFEEAVHGYGERSGLAALPTRWKWALLGLLAAALVAVAARFRRLAPPRPPAPAPQPPRRAHVEALASALDRTGHPGQAAAPVQEHARALLLRRAGLPPDAPEAQALAAARRFNLDNQEAEVIAASSLSDERVLAAGSALVKLIGAGR